jgi:hypothetical protein
MPGYGARSPMPRSSQRRPFACIIRQSPQVRNLRCLLWLRPGCTGIDLSPIVRWNQTIVDQGSAIRIHERHIAGPTGGNYRPAQQYRLGEHQPESLAAMQ